MKHSCTSQTWPRYQPQSPDSQQHGPPVDYVQRAQTYCGCPPLLNLGSASQPPEKSETHGSHTLSEQTISVSSGHSAFHRPPSHLSLGYLTFRLKNSNPTRSFPARKPLLLFDHPCCSSLNLFNLCYHFGDGRIRTLHKIQAHSGFKCHDDILSSSSNNSTLLLFFLCLALKFSQMCLLLAGILLLTC